MSLKGIHIKSKPEDICYSSLPAQRMNPPESISWLGLSFIMHRFWYSKDNQIRSYCVTNLKQKASRAFTFITYTDGCRYLIHCARIDVKSMNVKKYVGNKICALFKMSSCL